MRPDDRVIQPDGVSGEGFPIFVRRVGFLFGLVVEGKPVAPLLRVGGSAFRWNPGDPSVRPDLEVIVSEALGDGSTAVCDDTLPDLGGIPASADFSETQEVANAVNDLGCRFVNGQGLPVGRGPSEPCTSTSDGGFRFVDSESTIQFCGLIAERFSFPPGDTKVTARLRDTQGGVGPPASIIVRVQP